ncbi:MAG: hypothetical protein VX466_13345 [Myxococcota bacterium]|nr:hypothetical protein [Myxococcota bacterium]
MTEGHSTMSIVGNRSELRDDEIRIAEYSQFPRENSSEQPRIGFTRDITGLEMCLGVDLPEPIGSLLRLDLRTLDGEALGASIGRVVWFNGTHDGRFWLGLDLLCEINEKTEHEGVVLA